MSASYVHRYLVGKENMDWSEVMDRIQAKREDAIVRDLRQPGPYRGVIGQYYDVYIGGSLRATFDSEAEATQAVNEMRRSK